MIYSYYLWLHCHQHIQNSMFTICKIGEMVEFMNYYMCFFSLWLPESVGFYSCQWTLVCKIILWLFWGVNSYLFIDIINILYYFPLKFFSTPQTISVIVIFYQPFLLFSVIIPFLTVSPFSPFQSSRYPLLSFLPSFFPSLPSSPTPSLPSSPLSFLYFIISLLLQQPSGFVLS